MGKSELEFSKGLLKPPLGKSFHGSGGQRGAKEFSKRLWKNGGNPVGVFCGYLEADRSGFPPFFHMSVNPVISTRLVVNTGLGSVDSVRRMGSVLGVETEVAETNRAG